MRICYDYQSFVLQKFGGISRYFAKIGNEIALLGNQVKFIAPLHRNQYLKYLPSTMVEGKFISDYPKKSSKIFMLYNKYLSLAAYRDYVPDIIHETYYANRHAQINNRPLVLTVFDMIHELYPNEFSYFDRTIKDKKNSLNRADKIICISNNTKKDLLNIYELPEEKISVIHLGFEFFLDSISITNNDLNISKPFLLYVGNRDGYKNFSNLIDAFSCSPRLRADFNIVAFGGNSFSNKELVNFQKHGINLEQIKHVRGDDYLLSLYYQKASAFIYPSLYEGFGIPPLEAMSFGCPVISSDTSSMPEVIGDAAQYFNPSDIDSMIFAMESVLYSKSRIQELKDFGFHRVKKFSWSKCGLETEAIYKSII